MRHDWTLLCTRVDAQPREMVQLTNVFSVITITDRQRIPAPGDYLVVDPPGLLVSQWVAEFDADRQVHTASLQLMAPGGEQLIQEFDFRLDLRNAISSRMMFDVAELPFVGMGTYEFHVQVDAIGAIGEWGRACVDVR